MKHLILSTLMILTLGSSSIFAQQKKTKEVESTINQFTKALVDADSIQLSKLTYPSLKYAHSTGLVQNRQEFIDGILSGRSDFLEIKLTDQTIDIVGKTASVRHLLSAKTFDSKVPGTVKLEILLVWVKHRGTWRLLSRQAVKPYVK